MSCNYSCLEEFRRSAAKSAEQLGIPAFLWRPLCCCCGASGTHSRAEQLEDLPDPREEEPGSQEYDAADDSARSEHGAHCGIFPQGVPFFSMATEDEPPAAEQDASKSKVLQQPPLVHVPNSVPGFAPIARRAPQSMALPMRTTWEAATATATTATPATTATATPGSGRSGGSGASTPVAKSHRSAKGDLKRRESGVQVFKAARAAARSKATDGPTPTFGARGVNRRGGDAPVYQIHEQR